LACGAKIAATTEEKIMNFVFKVPATPSVAIAGEDGRFPIRRIFCVGRNYAEHTREMGKDPDRDPPFFFTKPADAIVADGETVAYPPLTSNFHHEGELVVAIGKAGFDIAEADAFEYIYGYAVGNDLTRRDLQLDAREKGRPWDWGKAFDRSAVCGEIHKVIDIGHVGKGTLTVTVNGAVRQNTDISALIWSVPEIVSFLSRSVRIQPGDLVYTGTPAGVGPLVAGDVCVVSIDGLGSVTTTIVERVS
jgi:fumarylpyruvate hydrolase